MSIALYGSEIYKFRKLKNIYRRELKNVALEKNRKKIKWIDKLSNEDVLSIDEKKSLHTKSKSE